MRQVIISFIIVIMLSSCSDKKAYRKELEQIDIQHQKCLDEGERMMDCSYQYSRQMDSSLNVVYNALMQICDEEEKNILIEEERKWIQIKDEELKRIYSSINKIKETEDFIPQDIRMIAYDEEASFIRKRVLELIEKYERH